MTRRPFLVLGWVAAYALSGAGCSSAPAVLGDLLYIQGSQSAFLLPLAQTIDVEQGAVAHFQVPTSVDDNPRWSPDGRWIAYNVAGENLRYLTGLAVVSRDGRTEISIAPVGSWVEEPAWSPDGTMLAYFYNSDPGLRIESVACRLYGSDCVDAAPTRISALGSNPTWTPDGKRIAYEIHGEINILSLNDSTVMPLGLDYQSCYQPQWAPHRDQIAVSCYDGSSRRIALVTMDDQGVGSAPLFQYQSKCSSTRR